MGTKLRDWAGPLGRQGPADTWAALSSNDSKTRYRQERGYNCNQMNDTYKSFSRDHALSRKFLTVFAFVQDKIENCGSAARWGAVFAGLFDFAVERDSPELLGGGDALDDVRGLGVIGYMKMHK